MRRADRTRPLCVRVLDSTGVHHQSVRELPQPGRELPQPVRELHYQVLVELLRDVIFSRVRRKSLHLNKGPTAWLHSQNISAGLGP